jgi:hypothetical protein
VNGGYWKGMYCDVNRNNFDSIWLEIDSSCNSCYTKFQNLPLKEKKGIRDHIKPALTEAILDHHFPFQRIKGKLKKLGFSGAAWRSNYFRTFMSTTQL